MKFGGIAGGAYDTTIMDCYNTGIIIGLGQGPAGSASSTWTNVGGIIGIAGENTITVKRCYNVGKVKSNYNYAGGIVGFSYVYNTLSSTNISYCYNVGSVESRSGYTGGISGNVNKVSSLSNVYNAGKITSDKAGAITGTNSGTLTYCRYVTGTANTGVYGKTDTSAFSTYETMDKMTKILSVVGSGGAFISDSNNINKGYPILKWQSK